MRLYYEYLNKMLYWKYNNITLIHTNTYSLLWGVGKLILKVIYFILQLLFLAFDSERTIKKQELYYVRIQQCLKPQKEYESTVDFVLADNYTNIKDLYLPLFNLLELVELVRHFVALVLCLLFEWCDQCLILQDVLIHFTTKSCEFLFAFLVDLELCGSSSTSFIQALWEFLKLAGQLVSLLFNLLQMLQFNIDCLIIIVTQNIGAHSFMKYVNI